MEIRHSFAKALRIARKSCGLTQEDFSEVSSRTYLSTLERAQKSPTLDKIDAISQTMGIHSLSLLTLTYLYAGKTEDIDAILTRIRLEIGIIHQDNASASPKAANPVRGEDRRERLGDNIEPPRSCP